MRRRNEEETNPWVVGMIVHNGFVLGHICLPTTPADAVEQVLTIATPHADGHLDVFGRGLAALLEVALHQGHIEHVANKTRQDYIGETHLLSNGGILEHGGILFLDHSHIAVEHAHGNDQSLRSGLGGVASSVANNVFVKRWECFLRGGDVDGHHDFSLGIGRGS